MNTTFGRHLLAEYRGCAEARLDDLDFVESLMRRAAVAAQATVVQATFHRFSPQGVSGVVVVMESHLSIHTWPEVGYAAVDFYTCGDCDPDAAHELLVEGLRAQHFELLEVHRGGLPGESISLDRHVVGEVTQPVHGAQPAGLDS